jgi:rare lipoprotein A
MRAGRPGATEEGLATYYAARLAGRRTASGERYDPALLTGAHPVLPFGARVRVSRLDDGAPAVVVRINDRCGGGRKIIDLSESAARRLGMLRAGVVRVRLVVLPATRSD